MMDDAQLEQATRVATLIRPDLQTGNRGHEIATIVAALVYASMEEPNAREACRTVPGASEHSRRGLKELASKCVSALARFAKEGASEASCSHALPPSPAAHIPCHLSLAQMTRPASSASSICTMPRSRVHRARIAPSTLRI